MAKHLKDTVEEAAREAAKEGCATRQAYRLLVAGLLPKLCGCLDAYFHRLFATQGDLGLPVSLPRITMPPEHAASGHASWHHNHFISDAGPGQHAASPAGQGSGAHNSSLCCV
jgi:hypothetical protein